MENQRISLSDRYLITEVGGEKLAFRADWIADILLVERSQLLVLPFYNPMLLGIINYHDQIVPLVSMKTILGEGVQEARAQQNLTVLRLRESVGKLGGVGLSVDRLIKSSSKAQLKEERRFEVADIPAHLWQPVN
jgi:chemotaxis signal transduction protein